MTALDYTGMAIAVREDVGGAQRRAWLMIGKAGTWWTGAERVAIAAEVRNATGCRLCQQRKAALSPFAIGGVHDSVSDLPAPAIDAIHRIRTDPGRLTRGWYERLAEQGLDDGEYVELVVVLALTVAVDTFARAIGSEPWSLPQSVPGRPTRVRPENLTDEGAYVPTIPSGHAGPTEADLYNPVAANIYRAISLVPDQARLFYAILGAQYLPPALVPRPDANDGRAISRPQMELLAARVSALNGCFY
ncbi:MAG: alkylhydroperoxidase-related (seleno)protein [Alphaproteobacteria bacterium]